MTSAFPHLFDPIAIGNATVHNRVVMGSMHTGLEDRSRNIERLAVYFAERARGGVGLIITGGYAPNRRGRLLPFGAKLTGRTEAGRHRTVTDAVHADNALIALQILHAGRYSYQPGSVSASAIKAPINPFTPRALTHSGVQRTIDDYVRCAELAVSAGYDGVEIMGGEGYFVNQFLAPCTNRRSDYWGGSPDKRRRLAVEIVRRIRVALGSDCMVIFRLSLAELVANGQRWVDIAALAVELESAGVDLFNTDIGWHEARVPTIVTSVPRAAFIGFTAKLKRHISIPVCASNRINMPVDAERILAEGQADLVSLARPLLADPEWVDKARESREDEINTCIACNQACLDHAFAHKPVSCLVNPRACRETTLVLGPTRYRKRIAVVGAGPAGLSAAVGLARRGHSVELFEADDHIGGQFDLARRIPGKQEFAESLRYFTRQLGLTGVTTRLNTPARAGELTAGGYDEVVLATGVRPRIPAIPGIDHPMVLLYPELVRAQRSVGRRVAVIGAGGIGFDVGEFLTTAGHPALDVAEWKTEWGVSDDEQASGQLTAARPAPPPREVILLQRKSTPFGAGLGKTTGWVHRATLNAKGVRKIGGVNYERIDDNGLHISYGSSHRDGEVLAVDNVVICAGQVSVRELEPVLRAAGIRTHVIGGADRATELDAKRAIEQGTRLAARL